MGYNATPASIAVVIEAFRDGLAAQVGMTCQHRPLRLTETSAEFIERQMT